MSFWNKLGSAVGSFVGSIPGFEGIGSGMQSYFGASQAEDQLRDEQNFNASEAEKNRQFQREERLAAQEYNSPALQLQRLKDAGINPNALFGSGTNPNVATRPQSGAIAAGTPSIASGMLLQDAEIANLMANTRKASKEADATDLQVQYDELTFDARVDLAMNAPLEQQVRIDKLIADENLQRKTFEVLANKSEEELKIMRQQLINLRNQNEEVLQSINESKARVGYIEEQTEGQDIANQLATIEKNFCTSTGFPINTPHEQIMFNLFKQGKDQEVYDYFAAACSSHEQVQKAGALNYLLPKLTEINERLGKVKGDEKERLQREKQLLLEKIETEKSNIRAMEQRLEIDSIRSGKKPVRIKLNRKRLRQNGGLPNDLNYSPKVPTIYNPH